MPNEMLNELQRRVSLAEQEAARTRTQIQELVRQDDRRKRFMRRSGAVGMAVLVLAGLGARTSGTQAQAGPQVMTVRAPFVVVDAAGKAIMRVGDAAGPESRGMNIYDAQGRLVASSIVNANGKGVVGAFDGNNTAGLGFSPQGDGHLLISRADGRLLADVGRDLAAFNVPMAVNDAAGKTIMRVHDATASVSRGMSIYDLQDQPIVDAVMNPHGKGVITARDKSHGAGLGFSPSGDGHLIIDGADGKLLLEVTKDLAAINTAVAVSDAAGKPIVKIDATDKDSRGMQVFGASGSVATSLTAGAQGGMLRMRNPAGAAVAGLFANDSGGGLALTGQNGGNSALSLSVAAAGGRVQVFPLGGGSAQAELISSGTGGRVSVYNSSGSSAGMLQSTSTGAGRLELGLAGQIMVEAGVLPTGVGVVRAGPTVGGPTGAGLAIPSVIMGKK